MRKDCEICGGPGNVCGHKWGKLAGRDFELRQCAQCQFLWVADPEAQPGRYYDEAYYRGQGADPWINYVEELELPASNSRRYEWRGILETVAAQQALGPGTRWLDFGCGNGGLVRHLRASGFQHSEGTEEGWIAKEARGHGIPVHPWRAVCRRRYDVITAIEVLEHVEKPVQLLAKLRKMLKPGGLFFYTTGNPKTFPGPLMAWPYITPEIHVSFYSPDVMQWALMKAGFAIEPLSSSEGYREIYRFKVAKTLRAAGALAALLPMSILAGWLDARVGLTKYPLGRALESRR
jgi:SAM-dependent methyltransferase